MDYFGTLDFRGKTVLEIGAGNGLYANCIAQLGAKHVVALEPEMDGSSEHVSRTFNAAVETLEIENVEFLRQPLESFSASEDHFDLIYMLAVINHIDESSVPDLDSDPATQQTYLELMQPLVTWLKPGGTMVITDASNWHLYMPLVKLGLLKGNPFQPDIDWGIHQPPEVWVALLKRLELNPVEFHWATNWRYRWMPRFLVDNPIAAQLYSTLFVVVAQKPC